MHVTRHPGVPRRDVLLGQWIADRGKKVFPQSILGGQTDLYHNGRNLKRQRKGSESPMKGLVHQYTVPEHNTSTAFG